MKCLPRTYWCHADHRVAGAGQLPPDDLTTEFPGAAVDWVRESVRAVSSSLDRETFHAVWAWLGDHRAVQAAVVELRRGKPYTFTVAGSAGRWTWTAHPVSVLPVAHTCSPNTPNRPLAKSAVVGVRGMPP